MRITHRLKQTSEDGTTQDYSTDGESPDILEDEDQARAVADGLNVSAEFNKSRKFYSVETKREPTLFPWNR